jgi:hypothetical protein
VKSILRIVPEELPGGSPDAATAADSGSYFGFWPALILAGNRRAKTIGDALLFVSVIQSALGRPRATEHIMALSSVRSKKCFAGRGRFYGWIRTRSGSTAASNLMRTFYRSIETLFLQGARRKAILVHSDQ